MEILKFYFNCILRFFKILDIDMFGLGFSVLSLILAAMFVVLIFNFLLHGFNIFESGKGLTYKSYTRTNDNGDGQAMSNLSREEQLIEAQTFTGKHGYAPSGYIDVWGDGTNVIPAELYFKDRS